MKNPLNCQETAQIVKLLTKVSGRVVLKLGSSSGLRVKRSDCSVRSCRMRSKSILGECFGYAFVNSLEPYAIPHSVTKVLKINSLNK